MEPRSIEMPRETSFLSGFVVQRYLAHKLPPPRIRVEGSDQLELANFGLVVVLRLERQRLGLRVSRLGFGFRVSGSCIRLRLSGFGFGFQISVIESRV